MFGSIIILDLLLLGEELVYKRYNSHEWPNSLRKDVAMEIAENGKVARYKRYIGTIDEGRSMD